MRFLNPIEISQNNFSAIIKTLAKDVLDEQVFNKEREVRYLFYHLDLSLMWTLLVAPPQRRKPVR